MKRMRWLMIGRLLGLSLLVSSCASKPGIKVLSEPAVRVTGEAFGGVRFTPTTRAVLRGEGIGRVAKKDPDAALRALDARLRQGEDAQIRRGAAEMALSEAYRRCEDDPLAAMGYLITAIRLSESGLALPASTDRDGLVTVYNEANAELAWLLHQQRVQPGKRLSVPTPFGARQVAWARQGSKTQQPFFYDTLMPRSRIKVKGFEDINHRPGAGGCLVGYRGMTEQRKAGDPFMPMDGYAIPVTAVVRWGNGGRAEVGLHDALVEDEVRVAGSRYPLAADYTAAVATLVNASPGSKVGFAGMIHPEKTADLEGLYLLEPYREDRIPLVLVHGLMSTPDTWRVVVNACYADPVIRKNYQLLVFFYPTGYPIAQNAATLREKLKGFQRAYDPQRSHPKMRNMVMVGHSMGSNLTNFQIRDGGDPLWYTFFDKPLEEVTEDSELRRAAKRGAYFKANPDITRVVFICGPHQGSPLSDSWLGRFGARLIGYPLQFMNGVSANSFSAVTPEGASYLSQPDSSINNLEVDSPLLEAVLKQPMPHDPVIHSIIGDRGKGGGLNSTDGVVPYWSSHLDYAKSEYFIPASHTQATKNPQNAEELKRILRLHVGER